MLKFSHILGVLGILISCINILNLSEINMKKRIAFALILMIICPFVFSGCNFDSVVNKFSKNLTTYNIEAEYNEENQTISAIEKVTYVNSYSSTLQNVLFHLYPNAFREGATYKPVSALDTAKAHPNGANYGSIAIQTVQLNGNNVAVNVGGADNNILTIELGEELFPDEKVNLEIAFVLTLPNINHRFGYGENAINLGNWYPVACVYEDGEFFTKPYSFNGDPFYTDIANYKVKFSAPEKFIVASSGNQVSVNTESGVKTLTAEAKAVRDFALVLSDKFEVLSQKVGDTEVKYYYYEDENSALSMQTAVDSLKTFNLLIGEYPYRTLSVVKTNFLHGGMEYPNLVYISDAIEDYADYKNVIVHEIAHQWWYGVVGNNQFSEGWLDEGLTEYTTLLFYKLNPEYERDVELIVKNSLDSYLLFTDVYKQVFGTVNTSMNRALDEYTTNHEYVYMAYVKGMLLFENLNNFIGDKKFYSSLKQYYYTNKMTIATQANLVAAFEKGAHVNLTSFFNSWVTGTVVIESIR